MNPDEMIDMQRLPCGCVFGSHVKTNAFVMAPCSETCEHYAYAVEHARKANKPIAQLDTRTEGNLVGKVRALSPIFNPLCLHCGMKIDAFTSSDQGNQPRVGDLSVCAYCKHVLFFTEHGFRKPTDEERVELEAHPDIQAMIAAARVVWGDDKKESNG